MNNDDPKHTRELIERLEEKEMLSVDESEMLIVLRTKLKEEQKREANQLLNALKEGNNSGTVPKIGVVRVVKSSMDNRSSPRGDGGLRITPRVVGSKGTSPCISPINSPRELDGMARRVLQRQLEKVEAEFGKEGNAAGRRGALEGLTDAITVQATNGADTAMIQEFRDKLTDYYAKLAH